MQERNTEKCIAIMIKASKVTGTTLKKAIKAYLNYLKNKPPKVYHGKQKVKNLVKSGEKLENVSVADDNIKSFDRIARKYGIDYSLKRDNTEDPPRYFIFFKAKDGKVMNAAFSEYTRSLMAREEKSSIKEKLRSVGEQVKAKAQERTREKSRTREAEL